MEENYKPVSSAFYEVLEELAVMGKWCEVRFWQNSGKVVVHGRIDKVYEKAGAAFLLMDSGMDIRLDKLIEVNGQPPYSFC